MSGDEDDGSVPTVGRQAACEFDAGHGAELDIEHQTAKLRVVRVRKEGLRRLVGDGLKACRAQQPAE